MRNLLMALYAVNFPMSVSLAVSHCCVVSLEDILIYNHIKQDLDPSAFCVKGVDLLLLPSPSRFTSLPL